MRVAHEARLDVLAKNSAGHQQTPARLNHATLIDFSNGFGTEHGNFRYERIDFNIDGSSGPPTLQCQ